MKTSNIGLLRYSPFHMILFVLFLSVCNVTSANATTRTFNKDSYIISADSCWQPNNDPKSVAQPVAAGCDTNKNDQSLFQVYGMLYAILDTGDQPDKCVNNDGTTPQQKAMLGYCKQIKVYWLIDQTKTDPQAADLTLTSSDPAVDTTGLVTVHNSSALTKAGSTTASVAYKGGPFVIDANDITTAEFNAIKAKFPSVKLHKANVPFSGNVDKVLVGKPPKIAVLSEGSSEVLEDYIRAAGSFAWRGTVFQYLSARDIIAGCLREPIPASCTAVRPDIVAPFQLIWAPHWVIEDQWNDGSNPTPTDQTKVVAEIRAFLEKGSSGFFECASIGSLEGTQNSNQIGMDVTSTTGGFLVDSKKTTPRIENNDGCFDNRNQATTCGVTKTDTSGVSYLDKEDYLKVEEVPFWLNQCGGWDFKPTTGLISSMRPYYNSGTPASSYTYLTTQTTDATNTEKDDRFVGTQLTRFVHDDSAKLNGAYSITGTYHVYDYLLGGRINGSPTQGYMIYFPGHKYISCSNNTTNTYPPSRSLDFQFNSKPDVANKITVELQHAKCTHGTNCPTVTFDLTTGSGTKSADNWVSLSAEFATYDPDTNHLAGVFFTSNFSDAASGATYALDQLQVTDLYTTFNGGATGSVKLIEVSDRSQAGSHQVLCSPNRTSAYPVSAANSVQCSLTKPATPISFLFDQDLTGLSGGALKVIQFSICEDNTCSASKTATASYDLNTMTGGSNSSGSGNLTLDLTKSVYDVATQRLSNVLVYRKSATCSDNTLYDIIVQQKGASGINLFSVVNDGTNDTICTPPAGKTDISTVSGASCAGYTPPPPAVTKITTAINFKNSYLSSNKNATNIKLTIDYTCGASCSGSINATYTTSSSPNSGASVSDSKMKIDMSGASFTNSNKTLSGIVLENLVSSNQLKITKVTIAFDGTKRLKSFVDTTNANTTIASWNDSSANPSSKSSLSYIVLDTTNNVATFTNDAFTYFVGGGICSYYISPYLSSCGMNWNSSNTCGIKYVLNTFLALKYQSVSSRFSKTQPIVKDNILYKASYDYPIYRGHLEMIKVPVKKSDGSYTSPVTVWDAAASIPLAGAANFPSAPLSSLDNTSPRYIFTNLPGSNTHIKFDPVSYTLLDATTKGTLKTLLGATTDNDAIVTINTVRGRKGASATATYASTSDCSAGAVDGKNGCDEDSKRLWAIEKSTPALKTKSQLIETSNGPQAASAISAGRDRRDRVLFAGGADGMLHAFYAGTYDSTTDSYPDTAAGKGTGKEIWAYIPSNLLSNLKNQPFTPDPANESSFLPKVRVDGSPMLDIFFVQTSTDVWKRKARLVSTASDTSKNEGVVFALDVTDQYTPALLWESSYNKTTDTGCLGTNKNCNMGESAGVAIGSVLMGKQIKNMVFLTSSWKSKKDASGAICATDVVGCTFGVSAYALDIETGNVVWHRSLPYTADAVGINDVPAAPVLMDRDNNGSYDYVVFGDMQGRVWALNTINGVNIKGDTPAYQVKKLGSDGKDASPVEFTNSAEPIGASVAVYRDYIVLATGGADYASDTRDYRVEVLQLKSSGIEKQNDKTIVTGGFANEGVTVHGEKIWAQPTISGDLKVVISTAKSYFSNQVVSTLESFGRILILDLMIGRTADDPYKNVHILGVADPGKHGTPPTTSDPNSIIKGGVVGGVGIGNDGRIYGNTLPGETLQAGTEGKPPSGANPYQILWWRKL